MYNRRLAIAGWDRGPSWFPCERRRWRKSRPFLGPFPGRRAPPAKDNAVDLFSCRCRVDDRNRRTFKTMQWFRGSKTARSRRVGWVTPTSGVLTRAEGSAVDAHQSNRRLFQMETFACLDGVSLEWRSDPRPGRVVHCVLSRRANLHRGIVAGRMRHSEGQILERDTGQFN